ncbi:NPCBM/NEW2 domain-containing protein [Spongiactinospora sp. TRM90649]|uniref:NPCBM/NEW2 domain-containing protein n=1 Tax=Spongiactinospora sp. TRM90649 TaxID=3031114 RepID=UPI0023FA0576|nr:NPCBM/NEW2 domain-containing protein [Spongiactinospora sp. TRM90649]MDF5751908.1 NPCBM/NEW2 domain-containing protein [Spongiactinospora sp. TRM90649]
MNQRSPGGDQHALRSALITGVATVLAAGAGAFVTWILTGQNPAPRTSASAVVTRTVTQTATATVTTVATTGGAEAEPSASSEEAPSGDSLALTSLNSTGDALVQGTWTLAGKKYPKSLSTSDVCGNDSTVVYQLPRPYQALTATVGLDDEGGRRDAGDAVKFEVYVDLDDDLEADENEQVTVVAAEYRKPGRIKAPLKGASTVMLRVSSGSCVLSPAVWGAPAVSGPVGTG